MRIAGVPGIFTDHLARYAKKLGWDEATVIQTVTSGDVAEALEVTVDTAAWLADGWSETQAMAIALVKAAEAKLNA